MLNIFHGTRNAHSQVRGGFHRWGTQSAITGQALLTITKSLQTAWNLLNICYDLGNGSLSLLLPRPRVTQLLSLILYN